jgi:hypothetical protein
LFIEEIASVRFGLVKAITGAGHGKGPGGSEKRSLTAAQFGEFAAVPPELEWLANITNPHTRRAYKNDVDELVAFSGLGSVAELLGISRHVIAWRKDQRWGVSLTGERWS